MLIVGRHGIVESLLLVGLIAIAIAHTEQVYSRLRVPDDAWQLSFSADCEALARAGAYGVAVFNPRTGKRRIVLSQHPTYLGEMSPDSRFVCAAGNDRSFRLWRTVTTEETVLLDGQHLSALAFSPDSKILAWAEAHGRVQFCDLASGQISGTLETSHQDALCISLSGDASLVAIAPSRPAAPGHVVEVWPVSGNDPPVTLSGPEYAHVQAMTFAPDRQHLAIGLSDGPVRIWDAAKRTVFRDFAWTGGAVHALRYSPDGRMLAAATGELIVLWDVGNGKQILTLRSTRGGIGQIAFCDRGRIIMAAGVDGDVESWSVHTGQRLRFVRGLTSSAKLSWWLVGGFGLWVVLSLVLPSRVCGKQVSLGRNWADWHLVTFATCYVFGNGWLLLQFDPRVPNASPLAFLGVLCVFSFLLVVLTVAVAAVSNRVRFSLLYLTCSVLNLSIALLLNLSLLMGVSV